MSKLRLAIQKKGRLSEKSLNLLRQCGISFSNGAGKLFTRAENFPLEILFLRDDDIPQYVEQKVADAGILGLNEVQEQAKQVAVVSRLGFSRCRLSIAVPRESACDDIFGLQGKTIATSYPNILGQYLAQQGIAATVEEISGSVEIAPGIGLADGICDLVSTGSTLATNGLKEVQTILESEAVLISSPGLPAGKQTILDDLLFRLDAVRRSQSSKYILLNAPNESLEQISRLLPGMKSPTIVPLAQSGWSSVQSVIREDQFWEVIGNLRQAGAEGILVVPIEKMIL